MIIHTEFENHDNLPDIQVFAVCRDLSVAGIYNWNFIDADPVLRQ